ncbi:MAG: hypothetical protein M3Q69_09905 [Acidobacteriota bacterium]|nr:hypothetical protein [Acidobacteriota bacterium]
MSVPIRFALLLTLAFASALDAQQQRHERLQLGALHFGMSLDAAREALPQTQWTVTDRHAETGRAYTIRGARAVTIAATEFDLSIGARALGAAYWELAASPIVRNAAECEQRTLAVIAELERPFGAFHKPGHLVDGETRVRAGASSDAVVSAAEKLRTVDRERAMRKDPEQFWVRTSHAPEGAEDPVALMGADYARDRGRTCRIEVTIRGRAQALDDKDLFRPDRLLAQPTISYRNRSLREIGAPSETLQFTISCSMRAGTGQVEHCDSGPDASPYRALAANWALDYRTKIPNPAPDDERLYEVEVPVKMGPADLRSVNVSSAPRLDLAQVKVKKQPYSPSFGSEVQLKQPAEVTVLCEVMEDGSLVCEAAPGTNVSPAVAAAAVKFAERAQVELTLRDGGSAVGGVFERRMTFKVHDDRPR